MEAWAIVTLVLGSNAIMGLVNWFVTKMQIKNSMEELEKRLKAQEKADKRERRREVRSQPLLKLRGELARMAGKGNKVASMVDLSSKEAPEEFRMALEDWSNYMASGEFEQVLFMQYDFELVCKADNIRLCYDIARIQLEVYWDLSDGDEKRGYHDKVKEAIADNEVNVSKVQSEINKLLEEL